MKTVRYEKTLVYYDGHQVVLARDLSGSAHLGVLVDQHAGTDLYVVVQVKRLFLEMFLKSEIDLLRLILIRTSSKWFLAEVSDDFSSPMSLVLQTDALEDKRLLPKPGLFIRDDDKSFKSTASNLEVFAIQYSGFHVDRFLNTQEYLQFSEQISPENTNDENHEFSVQQPLIGEPVMELELAA